MATSRSYPTSISKTVTFSGTLSLKHCGGAYLRTAPGDEFGSPPVDDGWIGSDYFHLFSVQNDGVYDTGSHSIHLSAFGGPGDGFGVDSLITMGIETRLFDARTDGTGDDFVWRTEITHCGTVLQRWDELRVVDTPALAPETVTIDFSVSFSADEWLYEIDSATGAGDRPGNSRDATFIYALKPTSDITSVVYGDTQTFDPEDIFDADPDLDGDIAVRYRNQLRLTLSGSAPAPRPPNTPVLTTLPDASALGDKY